MQWIGELWQLDLISVAHEHLTTAICLEVAGGSGAIG